MRDEDTMSNAKKVGAIFKDAVASLMPAHPCIGDVRGAGLYIGCEIVNVNAAQTAGSARSEYRLHPD